MDTTHVIAFGLGVVIGMFGAAAIMRMALGLVVLDYKDARKKVDTQAQVIERLRETVEQLTNEATARQIERDTAHTN
jgi:hypothetical protein